MPHFKSNQVDTLKNFLKQCNIHDGVFKEIVYDYNKKHVSVQIGNPGWGANSSIVFSDVKFFLCTADNPWGDDGSIIGLALVDHMPEMFDKQTKLSVCTDDCMLFVFEMFSGNKIFISCKELQIEEWQPDKA